MFLGSDIILWNLDFLTTHSLFYGMYMCVRNSNRTVQAYFDVTKRLRQLEVQWGLVKCIYVEEYTYNDICIF